jgi:hypothetical protein
MVMNNNDNNVFQDIDRSSIVTEDIIQNDPEALEAIQILQERGYTPEQVQAAMIRV